jgi:hypothetical protein
MENNEKILIAVFCIIFSFIAYGTFEAYRERQKQVAKERKEKKIAEKRRQVKTKFFRRLGKDSQQFDMRINSSGCVLDAVEGRLSNETRPNISASQFKKGTVTLNEKAVPNDSSWAKHRSLYVKVASTQNYMLIAETSCNFASGDLPSMETELMAYPRNASSSTIYPALVFLSGKEEASVAFSDGELHISREAKVVEEVVEPNPHYKEKRVTRSLLERKCGYGKDPDPEEECEDWNDRCHDIAFDIQGCQGRVENKYESATISHEEERVYRIDETHKINAKGDSITVTTVSSDSTVIENI